MAGNPTTTKDYEKVLKQKYSEWYNVHPDHIWLQKNLAYSRYKPYGGKYIVRLRNVLPQGYTLHSPNSAQDVNPPSEIPYPQVSIDVPGVSLTGQITEEALLATENEADTFGTDAASYIKDAKFSTQNKVEILWLYGRSKKGLGVISAFDAAAKTITIQKGQWATAIWILHSKARFEVIDGATGNVRGSFVLQSADPANFKIAVDAVPAGIVNNTDFIRFFSSGVNHNNITTEPMGLEASIALGATGGLYYGYDVTQDHYMRGVVKPSAAGLTQDLLTDTVLTTGAFHPGEKMILLVSQEGARQLDLSFNTNRRFDYSYNSGNPKLGFNDFTIETFNKIPMTPVLCYFLKNEEALILSERTWEIIGRTRDVTLANGRSGRMLEPAGINSLSWYFHTYCSNAPICHKLSANAKVTYLVT